MTKFTLIPTNGGFSSVNGLPIQEHVCIVYNRANLEVLAVTGTHNRAEEKATELFSTTGLDIIAGELRYHDDNISTGQLVGMTLEKFEFFVDNNSHPLIKR